MNTNGRYNPNKKYFNSEWLDKIDKRDQSLVDMAFKALKNSYSPYSNFRCLCRDKDRPILYRYKY